MEKVSFYKLGKKRELEVMAYIEKLQLPGLSKMIPALRIIPPQI